MESGDKCVSLLWLLGYGGERDEEELALKVF